MNKDFTFWKNQSSSLNRANSEESYEKIAQELYHIISGYTAQHGIVDFGCGAGELLLPLSTKFNSNIVAVDYSNEMLKAAQEKCKGKKIEFICKDAMDFAQTNSLQNELWMSCGGVNQYSDAAQLNQFILSFIDHPHAKHLLLFDTIDPIEYMLFFSGIISSYRNIPKSHRIKNYARLLIGLCRYMFSNLVMALPTGMGYAVHKKFWWQADYIKHLDIEIVSSMYFEYRYHVLIKKRT